MSLCVLYECAFVKMCSGSMCDFRLSNIVG